MLLCTCCCVLLSSSGGALLSQGCKSVTEGRLFAWILFRPVQTVLSLGVNTGAEHQEVKPVQFNYRDPRGGWALWESMTKPDLNCNI